MARGWESKAVEGQIESRRAERGSKKARPSSPSSPFPVQVDVVRKREDLMLSRTRVLRDLEATQNPRYKKLLTAALTHLDHELEHLPAVHAIS
jgi:hypothetical protein